MTGGGTVLTYDEAVLMLAALAASPDGKPDAHQAKAIERALAPVLKRLGPDGRRVALDLLREMLRAIGREATVESLRDALATPKDRAEAVRLAATVVPMDGKAGAANGERLGGLASMLGLSPAEFSAALPKRHSQPAPASNVPRLAHEEAVLMLAILTGSADGVPQDEEAHVLGERLATTLGSLGTSGRKRVLAQLTDLVDREGFDGALLAIRESLPEDDVRHQALRVAVSVAFADGRITRYEREHLERVARALRLSQAELASVLPASR